ncbi:hypothetical protein F2P81_014801 [Scophthalmus maximus]|uniref:Uncharacterized protein n=1 Tax=Scophthalmus maximus TaxID=52904 RepID=A0A6A4SN34_SCOMX|nr:hypothetical protein F2P81_014801 [Scophthalmus maximus]
MIEKPSFGTGLTICSDLKAPQSSDQTGQEITGRLLSTNKVVQPHIDSLLIAFLQIKKKTPTAYNRLTGASLADERAPVGEGIHLSHTSTHLYNNALQQQNCDSLTSTLVDKDYPLFPLLHKRRPLSTGFISGSVVAAEANTSAEMHGDWPRWTDDLLDKVGETRVLKGVKTDEEFALFLHDSCERVCSSMQHRMLRSPRVVLVLLVSRGVDLVYANIANEALKWDNCACDEHFRFNDVHRSPDIFLSRSGEIAHKCCSGHLILPAPRVVNTDGKHMGRHRKEDRCIERMTETVIDEEMGGAAWRRNMKIVSVIVWIRACVLIHTGNVCALSVLVVQIWPDFSESVCFDLHEPAKLLALFMERRAVSFVTITHVHTCETTVRMWALHHLKAHSAPTVSELQRDNISDFTPCENDDNRKQYLN